MVKSSETGSLLFYAQKQGENIFSEKVYMIVFVSIIYLSAEKVGKKEIIL